MTNWIRYRITDRSGSGWETDHWLHLPGFVDDQGEDADDELREYIVRTHESWALYAERYSFQLWRNETPPADVVQKEIEKAERAAARYLQLVKELTAQLKE